MYRVELKGAKGIRDRALKGKGVPNVPCGVERHEGDTDFQQTNEFLMYRVELKD